MGVASVGANLRASMENFLCHKKPECVCYIAGKLRVMIEKACEANELIFVVTYGLCRKLL